jgi:S-DNA-T family DNA segregation ATPase FtsK/SpoIIIE
VEVITETEESEEVEVIAEAEESEEAEVIAEAEESASAITSTSSDSSVSVITSTSSSSFASAITSTSSDLEVIAEAEETEVIAETKAPVVETFVALEEIQQEDEAIELCFRNYFHFF